MKSYTVYVASVLSVVLLVGCGSSVEHATQTVVDEIVDQAANVAQLTDENVNRVKGGYPNGYPDITYGEAFEDYFGDPTWKSFKGTQDGPDEDGDGEPDYTIDDVNVVEFTGYCMYQDVRVKALIQFALDKENGTFTAEYLSFNDVPQNMLMLYGLINNIFEDYQSSHSEVENKDSETAQDSENTELENPISQNDSNSSSESEQLKESIMVYYALYYGRNSIDAEIDHEDSDTLTVRIFDPYANATSNTLGYYEYNKKMGTWKDVITGEKLDFGDASDAQNEKVEAHNDNSINLAAQTKSQVMSKSSDTSGTDQKNTTTKTMSDGLRITYPNDYNPGVGVGINEIIKSLDGEFSSSSTEIIILYHELGYDDDGILNKDNVFFDCEIKSPKCGYYYRAHQKEYFARIGDAWMPSIVTNIDDPSYDFSSLNDTCWEFDLNWSSITRYIKWHDNYDLYQSYNDAGSEPKSIKGYIRFKNFDKLSHGFGDFGAANGIKLKATVPLADVMIYVDGKRFEFNDVRLKEGSFSAGWTPSLNFTFEHNEWEHDLYSLTLSDKDNPNNINELRKVTQNEYNGGNEKSNNDDNNSNTRVSVSTIEYVVDGSDTGYFEKSFFENFSDEELRLARNEIFARRGRKFKDESLQSYFNSKSWYVPRYSPEEFDAQMDSILNDWEKENIKTIKEIEDERKGQ